MSSSSPAPLSAVDIQKIADANLRRLTLKAEADHADLLSAAGHADLAALLGECQSALSTLADLLSLTDTTDSTRNPLR